MASEMTLDNIVCGRIFGDEGWTDFQYEMTDEDIEQLTYIMCSGCRRDTKTRFSNILRYDVSNLSSDGIFQRVVKTDSGWQLFAAQDYTVDRKAVRESVLNG